MYRRILLAADGSENSIRAAEEAAKIASLISGSMVEILYVADMSKIKSEVLHSQSSEEFATDIFDRQSGNFEIFDVGAFNA